MASQNGHESVVSRLLEAIRNISEVQRVLRNDIYISSTMRALLETWLKCRTYEEKGIDDLLKELDSNVSSPQGKVGSSGTAGKPASKKKKKQGKKRKTENESESGVRVCSVVDLSSFYGDLLETAMASCSICCKNVELGLFEIEMVRIELTESATAIANKMARLSYIATFRLVQSSNRNLLDIELEIVAESEGHSFEAKKSERETEVLESGMDGEGGSAKCGTDCVICIERTARVVMIPCGHICLCKECWEELKERDDVRNCPVCGCRAQQTFLTYI